MRTIALLVVGILLARSTTAQEWPQFRGPDGQGHTSAANLPLTWSQSENIAWKTPIEGRGWSSPVVGDGRIWLTTAIDEGRSLRAVCVELSSGKIVRDIEVFKIANPPTLNAKNSPASPSPVLEGNRLYVHYGTSGTACLDAATGKVLWRNQELKLDHKEGPGSSPIVWRDLLIVNCDGTDVQYVAALDKRTGQLAWKTNRRLPISDTPDYCKAYCTPLVVRLANGSEELISPGASRVIAYDPATGRELWYVNYEGFSNVPKPLFDNGLVYICTGYMQPQLWALRPGGEGDVTASHVVWKMTKQAPANPSPVLVDRELYVLSDQGIMTCVDATTGSELWRKRLPGGYSSSLLAAPGRIYAFNEDGVTSVLAAGRKAELLAENTLDERIMASPAIVGDALVLRTAGHLYRIEAGAKQTAAVK
ncbi:MAG: PQQ-binding-like beta-propeller repeat protein [Pirellulales bacterium]|nr:PQQ-binding-like beta-propeller repeat protein [Pirellulales bacterium]